MQLALGRKERLAAEAVVDEIDEWIGRADAAFREIVGIQKGDPERAPTEVITSFLEDCGAFIEESFGQDERAALDAAAKKNIYSERIGKMMEPVGSIIVLERWLERCRARVYAGRLRTVDGVRMRD